MSDDWPSAGTLLATRYRLVELLETGGMAQIWRATDELLGRPVAVKLPTGPQVAWREARMAAKLSHPGIAAVHDYREAVRSDGTVSPFVVLELLGGETVALRLTRETFEWPEAARVGAAVADALAAAHASGVVHRDIKPGNVMLTPTGVKILDFGISAAAGEPDDDDTGATFGTPAYVAPERLDGMPAEPATDVYGLGVLLFEMVTGQPPYPVETWEELEEARESGPSTLPTSLPEEFRAVVERCLAEDPAARPEADDIRFELTALWLAEKPSVPESPVAEAGEAWSGPVAVWASTTGAATTGAQLSGMAHPRSQLPGAGRPGAAAVSGTSGSSAVGGGAVRGSAGPGRGHGGADRPAGIRPGSTGASRGRNGEPVAATAGRRPRATEVWAPRPGGRVAGMPEYSPGSATAPGTVSGRAAAATLPRIPARPRNHRLVIVLGVLALLAAAGGFLALANRPRDKTDAAPPPPPPIPATHFYRVDPTPPTPAPTTTAPPSRSPSPAATLSFDDAVTRLRAAVERAGLRADVATDLLNLIQPLGNANNKDVQGPLAAIRRKINDRAGEGSLTAAQATTLRARLTDLDRAAGA